MEKETIGLLMIRPEPVALKGDEEVTIATTFLPVEQLPDGKVKVLSPEQGRKMWELGFRPIVAVKSNVSRQGGKVTIRGFELYLLHGAPAAWREVIEQHSPKMVEAILEDYYANLNARSDKTEMRLERSVK
jgi:hypothetical protein